MVFFPSMHLSEYIWHPDVKDLVRTHAKLTPLFDLFVFGTFNEKQNSQDIQA